MAQETKTQQQQPQKSAGDEITTAPPGDEEEIEEIEIPQNKTVMDKLQMICEKFAATGMGQTILGSCDRVLKVLEETSKWSLPQDDTDAKLERPLPWIFFIPLIVWLRVIRMWLSFVCIMMGGSPMTAEKMVYNIQIKRRRLRAIRVPALRAARRMEPDSSGMMVSGKNQTFMGKIRSLFGSAVCKPGQRRDVPSRRAFGMGNISKVMEEMSGERSVKRPRDDDNADLNMTVDQMLEKYANEDSEDDSDYVPNEEDEESSSSSSSESISSAEAADLSKSEASKDQSSSLDHSVVEVKENGGPKHRPMPKPIADIKLEPISDADSGSDMAKTPKPQSGETNKSGSQTKSSTEVATVEKQQQQKDQQQPPQKQQQSQQHQEKEKEQQKEVLTPKNQHKLNIIQDPEAKQKSTPGHESAASLKPVLGAKTAAASQQTSSPKPPSPQVTTSPTFREKYYRTITTETSITEYDWSIVVKTEITQRKSSPAYRRSSPTYRRSPVPIPRDAPSSFQLTPASSTEDIFYSPIGSPQDFHHIFHPAPIVKITPAEAHHSTPKEADEPNDSSASETPETQQKKPQNKQQQHHHHQQYHHHNNKNRNKNRR
ncbi:probable WRKY transcription factor protein 1 isoform X1 [Musca domestica]|uniref:Flocculation protein FLO11 isoform X1 n=2 Tax=Musca domestica TaxID=7370 RepID=T1PK11_MUSDO|nr:probable WRKY transcription factor protein 1 isoform X1 [Musca domestica]